MAGLSESTQLGDQPVIYIRRIALLSAPVC